jgi:hypothetical protein
MKAHKGPPCGSPLGTTREAHRADGAAHDRRKSRVRAPIAGHQAGRALVHGDGRQGGGDQRSVPAELDGSGGVFWIREADDGERSTAGPIPPMPKNCTEAREMGLANAHRGEPGYAPWMDGDGICCEPVRRR